MIDRRSAMVGALATMLAACGEALSGVPRTAARKDFALDEAALQRLEQAAGGRLGAFVLDPATGAGFGWREHERFAHCSSFKLSLAAMLLAGADRGQVDLEEVLRWSEADLLSHSPVTAGSTKAGLSVRDLARGTVVTSDNTAANVLLRRFGGPEAMTRFWRSMGDTVSRLDRYEPELNQTPPGTDLDTSTPAAMAQTVARLVTGDILAPASRVLLREWMTAVATGRDRIRAGFPSQWISGDKTGTGAGKTKHTYVDLAFGGPAGTVPVIVAAYFEPERLADTVDPAAMGVLADLGRLAAAWLIDQDGSGRPPQVSIANRSLASSTRRALL